MGSITLEHVNKSFGEVEIIPDISLDIQDGEFVVFVGPSGCGKSTLLRLIAGLEDTTSGHIKLDGQDVTDAPPAKRTERSLPGARGPGPVEPATVYRPPSEAPIDGGPSSSPFGGSGSNPR